MEIQEILNKINAIVCDVLDDENIILTAQTTAKDVEGWDSLTNIQIITAIEKQFNIRFKLNEILGFQNIGEVCNTILKMQK